MDWLADKRPIVAPLRLNYTLLKRRTTSCAVTAKYSRFTAACPPQAQCQYLEWAIIKKLIKAFAHERSALSRHFTNMDGATLFSCSSGTIYSRVISVSAISLRSRSFSTQQVRVATLAPSPCMPLKLKPPGTTESDCLTSDPDPVTSAYVYLC